MTSSYTRALQTAAILSREQDFPIRVETDLYQWVANKNYTYETDEIA
ncbi:histidine phosphatase family protein [Sellimonas intestinalis]|nr:histidine phosphatase family protein [Sellimonas intestinalis]MBA2212793.1 histidine phosphatase family protein [Sellimonas intestinalis]